MSVPKQEHAFPSALAFLLDNPLKRWLRPPSKLVDKLGLAPTDCVVDFGCGPGFYTVELARRARSTVAVDISSGMLEKARRAADRAGLTNVRFIESDGRSLLPLEDGGVDLVLLVTVYHELKESAAALGEFRRVLKGAGRLVILEKVKRTFLPGPPLIDPEALRSEIEAGGFKLARMEPFGKYGLFFFTATRS